MLERLGNVFYWAGLGIAGLFLLLSLWGIIYVLYMQAQGMQFDGSVSLFFHFWKTSPPLPNPTQSTLFAVIALLFGKAARYVLTGKF